MFLYVGHLMNVMLFIYISHLSMGEREAETLGIFRELKKNTLKKEKRESAYRICPNFLPFDATVFIFRKKPDN